MVIVKQYIGQYESANGLTQYYMIQKDAFYGVELVEKMAEHSISTSEWFSEDRESTLDFVQSLYLNGASSIHLSELIDDYVI